MITNVRVGNDTVVAQYACDYCHDPYSSIRYAQWSPGDPAPEIPEGWSRVNRGPMPTGVHLVYDYCPSCTERRRRNKDETEQEKLRDLFKAHVRWDPR